MDTATETGFIKKDEKGERIGTGEEGCKGYLKWLCLHEPRTYAALMRAACAARDAVPDVTAAEGWWRWLTDDFLTRFAKDSQFKKGWAGGPGRPHSSAVLTVLQGGPTPERPRTRP
jgi:hypothetical protein